VSVLQKSRATAAYLSDDETSLVIDYYVLFTAFGVALTLTLTDISNAWLGLRTTIGI
jgi:hypothetical protein